MYKRKGIHSHIYGCDSSANPAEITEAVAKPPQKEEQEERCEKREGGSREEQVA